MREVNDHGAEADPAHHQPTAVEATLLGVDHGKVSLQRQGHQQHHTHTCTEKKEILLEISTSTHQPTNFPTPNVSSVFIYVHSLKKSRDLEMLKKCKSLLKK